MLLPDRPSDEGEGATAGWQAPAGGRGRSVGRVVTLIVGVFVVATLAVVALWWATEPVCDHLDVAAFAPECR